LAILRERPRRGELVFANSSGNKCTHSWDDCKKIHRDIASPMRYLAKAESKKVREKVNAVWV
jgi:hypothetical protein